MTPEEGQAGDKIAGFGAIAPIMVQGTHQCDCTMQTAMSVIVISDTSDQIPTGFCELCTMDTLHKSLFLC